MEKLLNDITELFEAFKADAAKDTNKAAARRARKLTLELSQVFKDFRKVSVKEV